MWKLICHRQCGAQDNIMLCMLSVMLLSSNKVETLSIFNFSENDLPETD